MSNRKPLPPAAVARRANDVASLKHGFDFVGDHVVITDENAHILYANKAVERMTGYPLAEVIGQNPADLWGGHMSLEFYTAMWRQIEEKKSRLWAKCVM